MSTYQCYLAGSVHDREDNGQTWRERVQNEDGEYHEQFEFVDPVAAFDYDEASSNPHDVIA